MDPYILAETEDFAVVFKPPRMHSAPASPARRYGDTLLDWYAGVFPAVMDLSGRKEGEGGLLHRLDYETQGLLLIAKNQQSLDRLLALQNEEKIIKEYSAICQKNDALSESFPPPPQFSGQKNFIIESYFRPFGPGGQQVRPLTIAPRKTHSGYYHTEIVNVTKIEPHDRYSFTVWLRRGFRHQIRCHLAWIGCPILNDPLYGEPCGEQPADALLALRATGLVFDDPRSGEPREYCIEPWK